MGKYRDKDRKKTKMKSFRIDELSSVDRPAQEHAISVIMKRDGESLSKDDIRKRLPSVEKGESPDKFISRFIEDEFVKSIFKELDDRKLLAESQLEKFSGKSVCKRAVLTTSVNGHSHLIILDFENGREPARPAGNTSYETGDSGREDDYHSHPWVMVEGGEIIIGTSNDHTHEEAQISVTTQEVEDLLINKAVDSDGGTRQQEEDTLMPDKSKTAAEDTAAQALATMTKRAERAEAVAELTDAQKSYFQGLDNSGQDEFLKMSSEDRCLAVTNAEKADPVVYKGDDGNVYRKSDDPRLVAMAKGRDEDRRELLKAKEDTEKARLEKRARDEVPNLPGDVNTKVSLLKAVESISDEAERDGALAALKAQNARLGKALTTYGSQDSQDPAELAEQTDENAAQVELNKRIAKYASDHKVTEAKATELVMQTPEAQELYEQARKLAT